MDRTYESVNYCNSFHKGECGRPHSLFFDFLKGYIPIIYMSFEVDFLSNENKKQSQKNTTAGMVALIAALVAGVLILVIALGSIFSDDAGDEKTPYIISTEAQEDTTVSGVDTDNDILVGDVENESTAADGNNGGQQAENPDNSVNNGDGKNPVDNDEDKETQNSAIEYYEQLSPNGDNKLSDHYVSL